MQQNPPCLLSLLSPFLCQRPLFLDSVLLPEGDVAAWENVAWNSDGHESEISLSLHLLADDDASLVGQAPPMPQQPARDVGGNKSGWGQEDGKETDVQLTSTNFSLMGNQNDTGKRHYPSTSDV